MEFASLLYFPASQITHSEAATPLYQPAGHSSQLVLASFECFPASQKLQKAEASRETNPSSQGVHWYSPGAALVPARQLSQPGMVLSAFGIVPPSQARQKELFGRLYFPDSQFTHSKPFSDFLPASQSPHSFLPSSKYCDVRNESHDDWR